jgi:membrane fusion protein (multidrug efflux system)
MQYSNKRFLFFSLLFLCVFVFSDCKNNSSKQAVRKETPATIVDVIIAETEPVSDVIEANGTVIAGEYVELRPEVSGRLTYLNVPEGRPVTQGTIVARVNDADLRAQMAKSKVQLELAQKTVDRYKQLLDVNGINQADYDVALNQVNSFKADMVYTQALLDKTVIKAPFSGVAGLRAVSPGAYVTPATVIASLQQTSQVKIDFTLPETYSNVIKNGMLISVQIDAATKEIRKAIIVATEPGANTDTRNLKVRAVLQGGTANPGGFVKVYIDAGKNRSSIKVPTNCIIPDDKNNQVILVKNGLASFVNIKTGIREANSVEVIQGINVGDSIVVTGVLFARPKSVVQVRSVKKLQDLTPAGLVK